MLWMWLEPAQFIWVHDITHGYCACSHIADESWYPHDIGGEG